jgi:hypothetical protein
MNVTTSNLLTFVLKKFARLNKKDPSYLEDFSLYTSVITNLEKRVQASSMADPKSLLFLELRQSLVKAQSKSTKPKVKKSAVTTE